MNLRKILSTSAATLALFAGAPALADAHMDTASATVEAELPSGPEGPALWKVADEDTTIYLFGTVHALDPEVVWYDAEIDAALSSSDTLVTEIAMDPQNQAAMQQLAMQAGMSSDGTTVRSLLDDEQKAAYEAGLTGLGIPAEAFDPMEPWLVGLTLTMLPLLQQGYDLEAGVDKVIVSKAGDVNKEALETAEYQLGLFDGLSPDQQVKFLMAAVEGMPDVKEMLDKMVGEWLEGDAEGLAELMNEDLEDTDFAEILLYNRNANWAEWIEDRLEQPGTVFIAVGAGHLAGERSVQDYLAERAIETSRVQ